jgi:hypothetical protein
MSKFFSSIADGIADFLQPIGASFGLTDQQHNSHEVEFNPSGHHYDAHYTDQAPYSFKQRANEETKVVRSFEEYDPYEAPSAHYTYKSFFLSSENRDYLKKRVYRMYKLSHGRKTFAEIENYTDLFMNVFAEEESLNDTIPIGPTDETHINHHHNQQFLKYMQDKLPNQSYDPHRTPTWQGPAPDHNPYRATHYVNGDFKRPQEMTADDFKLIDYPREDYSLMYDTKLHQRFEGGAIKPHDKGIHRRNYDRDLDGLKSNAMGASLGTHVRGYNMRDILDNGIPNRLYT